jgi:hypothetical protein
VVKDPKATFERLSSEYLQAIGVIDSESLLWEGPTENCDALTRVFEQLLALVDEAKLKHDSEEFATIVETLAQHYDPFDGFVAAADGLLPETDDDSGAAFDDEPDTAPIVLLLEQLKSQGLALPDTKAVIQNCYRHFVRYVEENVSESLLYTGASAKEDDMYGVLFRHIKDKALIDCNSREFERITELVEEHLPGFAYYVECTRDQSTGM